MENDTATMPDKESKLTATADGQGRLDAALARAFPDISRARFKKLIVSGAVLVDGETALDPSSKVQAGQEIIVDVPKPAAAEPKPEAMPLVIVYEDKDLIVIDKPAGLVVHPGAGNETGTLVNALIAHCGDSLSGIGGVMRPGIVHRIDKETSGLLVIAKNDAAHQGLSAQFAAHGRDGKLQRSYLAVVWGVPSPPSGMIDTGYGRSRTNRKKMAVSRQAAAKRAVTHYGVIETYGAPPVASLVRCQLETGRTHQIRVHLAHIGHPVVGDMVYGAGRKSAAGRFQDRLADLIKSLKGQALHATELGFSHPRTGRALHFESPLPRNLAALAGEFRKLPATENGTQYVK